MLIIKEEAKAEIIIKKSRFISETMAVSSPEAARELLRTRKELWNTMGITHLVYAFITGPGANIMGYSDDGEPSGTAGRPVLEVLKGSGITNVMLTVARYFGGIKLGTGGLVKAYTQSAQEVLAVTETVEMVPMTDFRLNCPYQSYEKIKLGLTGLGAVVKEEVFNSDVQLTATIREEMFQDAVAFCRDSTRGQALPVPIDDISN